MVDERQDRVPDERRAAIEEELLSILQVIFVEPDNGVAAERLVRMSGEFVSRLVARQHVPEFEREEVKSDALTRIWRYRIAIASAVLQGKRSPIGYIYRVIWNVVRDVRSSRRLAMSDLPLDEGAGNAPIAGTASDAAELAEINELRARVIAAVDTLPEKRRTVMTMLLSGMSHGDVALALGIKQHVVRSRAHDARLQLMPLLAGLV